MDAILLLAGCNPIDYFLDDACEQAFDRQNAKYESCNMDQEGSFTSERGCNEDAAVRAGCATYCIEQAPCGVLNGTDTDYTGDAWFSYTECVANCGS